MKKTIFGRMKAFFRTRNFSVGGYSVLAVVIVLAIAVVLNLAVGALPVSATQIDMTPEKLYSLSEETMQSLDALEQDVDIFWIVQTGAEDPTLRQILSRYADSRRVNVRTVDPVTYPNFASAYTDEKIMNNALIVVCGERSLYIGYDEIWTYSDYDEYMYYLETYGQGYSDTFLGEQKITGAIGYVTSETLPVMYRLTGHGETAPSDGVSAAVTLRNTELKELDLVSAGAVPDDCDILYLAAPTRDLTAAETSQLRDYVRGGGRLCVTTQYTTEPMPNFTSLLADWGIGVENGYVLESDGRYSSYGYVDLILPELQSHSITSPLSADGLRILMPDCQSLTMTETADNIKVSSLLKSSAGSYRKGDLAGLTDYSKASDDPAGPFVLAAAGTDSATGARIAVFASNVFMENEYSDMVAGANMDLFLNALDWLSGGDKAPSVRAKTLSVDYLSFSGSAAVTAAVVLVLAVPLGVLALGVATFVKRRRR